MTGNSVFNVIDVEIMGKCSGVFALCSLSVCVLVCTFPLTCLRVCPSICVSVYVFFRLCVRLSGSPSACLSIFPSVGFPSLCISVSLRIFLSVCRLVSVCLSACLPVSLSLSVCLSVCLPVCLSSD